MAKKGKRVSNFHYKLCPEAIPKHYCHFQKNTSLSEDFSWIQHMEKPNKPCSARTKKEKKK